jgi:hypothetical protein
MAVRGPVLGVEPPTLAWPLGLLLSQQPASPERATYGQPAADLGAGQFVSGSVAAIRWPLSGMRAPAGPTRPQRRVVGPTAQAFPAGVDVDSWIWQGVRSSILAASEHATEHIGCSRFPCWWQQCRRYRLCQGRPVGPGPRLT